jgi:hypothetical protein
MEGLGVQFYFGKAVRQIVEGETRFSKIGAIGENASRAELAALDLKQLFLAMTEEVRIIVVKLADRLHNMRTLDSMPAHKQKKIADETLLVSLVPGLSTVVDRCQVACLHSCLAQHANGLRLMSMGLQDGCAPASLHSS